MKHNMGRVLRLTQARTFWVRAVRAWRNLLPDWTPTLDALKALEEMPHEHRAAVAIVSHGWDANDARWDVLMALLEYERREECKRVLLELSKPKDTMHTTYVSEEVWDDIMQGDFEDGWDESGPEPTEDERRERVVVPWKLVTKMGQTLQSGETTVETPLKAAFLDRLTPVKHLREKDTNA